MKKLYFMTSNTGKVAEFHNRLNNIGYSLKQKNMGYPEIQAETLEDVADFGATWIQQRFPRPFLLEDSGLFITALQGFPGVYSKYVFYTIGLSGVLHLLKKTKTNQRKAVFRSVIAYCEPHHKPVLFRGECIGTIRISCKGTHGFGYDPLFVPKGHTKTFAEMTVEEKNQYSHRGQALQKLIVFLQKKEKKEKL